MAAVSNTGVVCQAGGYQRLSRSRSKLLRAVIQASPALCLPYLSELNCSKAGYTDSGRLHLIAGVNINIIMVGGVVLASIIG